MACQPDLDIFGHMLYNHPISIERSADWQWGGKLFYSCREGMLMNLKIPNKNTMGTALFLAAIALIIYVAHIVAQNIIHVQILHLQLIAFILMSIAFGLLFLGLTMKEF